MWGGVGPVVGRRCKYYIAGQPQAHIVIILIIERGTCSLAPAVKISVLSILWLLRDRKFRVWKGVSRAALGRPLRRLTYVRGRYIAYHFLGSTIKNGASQENCAQGRQYRSRRRLVHPHASSFPRDKWHGHAVWLLLPQSVQPTQTSKQILRKG